MENRVYLCSWKKEGERFRVWVTRRPSIAAEGKSFHVIPMISKMDGVDFVRARGDGMCALLDCKDELTGNAVKWPPGCILLRCLIRACKCPKERSRN